MYLHVNTLEILTSGLWLDASWKVNREGDQYAWWSNCSQAWSKNVGWQIDYQIVSTALKSKIKATSIYKDERFSDHAPLIVDYDL